MNQTKESVQRNINPHAEALFAMFFYGHSYSLQHGGCMDFWDRLTVGERKLCMELTKKIKETRSKHAPFHGSGNMGGKDA